MKFRRRSRPAIVLLASAALLTTGCSSSSADFQTFMHTTLPARVTVMKMDGNWGADPWRCWEISPADEELKRQLITTWNLAPNPKAFNGVASGGQIYCQFDNLRESFSGSDSQSYRAVGIDATKNVMFVYFYNG